MRSPSGKPASRQQLYQVFIPYSTSGPPQNPQFTRTSAVTVSGPMLHKHKPSLQHLPVLGDPVGAIPTRQRLTSTGSIFPAYHANCIGTSAHHANQYHLPQQVFHNRIYLKSIPRTCASRFRCAKSTAHIPVPVSNTFCTISRGAWYSLPPVDIRTSS